MQVSEAVKFLLGYHRADSKGNTIRAYEMILSKFCQGFGSRNLNEVSSDEILSFLNAATAGRKQQTKRTRYSHLSAFFNFIRINVDQNLQNPCDTPMMKKLFRAKTSTPWNIIDKESVDEIIFTTPRPRHRLMLELMARGGMTIGEVLKLTPGDINDRKLMLRDPKSGKESEVIFMPEQVANRLKAYIQEEALRKQDRVFNLCYTSARTDDQQIG